MAKTLTAFLAQNAKKIDNRTVVASPRFVGEDGKPMQWEICPITAEENARIRRDCIRSVPVPGRRGQYTSEFDPSAYQAKLSARCTVFPDLNNAALQESYGVMGAEKLLATMLSAGEFEDYSREVLELNGFTSSADERVEEAKN